MTWSYLDDNLEQCTYSPGRGEESLPTSSLDTVPSALLRLIPTADGFCSPDKQTESCLDSQSGTTSQPSTGNHGGGKSTSSQGDSRVRTSAQLEKGKESPGQEAGSGGRWRELSVRYDPDTHSWKTHRCLWVEDLQPCSVTLPRWGMMRDGVIYRRRTAERPIRETGFGYWQTPVADDAVNRKRGKWNSRGEPKLSAQVKRWPTPVKSDSSARRKTANWAGGRFMFTSGDSRGYNRNWQTEPDVGRVANGVAARVDRLKAIGNGQVPAVAALAWRILTEGI